MVNDRHHTLALCIQDGASVGFTTRTTADAGQTRSSKLAAEFHVQAAEANLSTASGAVSVLVHANVGTAECATQNNVFFVNSVVASHLDIFCCLSRRMKK